MRSSKPLPLVDDEVTERFLDLVRDCVADGTMRYECGANGKIYVRLVESGTLFRIVPGGLIRAGDVTT